MKLGYQDVGSWTLMESTPVDRRKAAWLYAQFTVSKTVSLKKTIVGLTPIRESDIQSKPMQDLAPKLAGLVEFYASPARIAWTPTGTNVPDYPKLAQLWWANVAEAVTGEKTAQEAMDSLAEQQDDVLRRLQRAGIGGDCAPKLNEERDIQYWIDQPGAPRAKLANEKPQGVTVDYDLLLNAWKQGKVMPDGIKG
jgi:glycerol transport system substrate-binding protein